MRRLMSALVVCAVLVGCGDKKSPSATVIPPSANLTPAEKLYEQLRGGLFQIDTGLAAIEDAVQEAKNTEASTAEIKQSLVDIQDAMDSAGDSLSEEVTDGAQKGQAVAIGDARRKKLIDLTNDALHDLRDARGIVDSLAADDQAGPLEPVGLKIDEAMASLREALKTLGGQEELEE